MIFTNSAQGTFLAHHVKQIMGYDTAHIIYDVADNYSTSLARAFESTFTDLEGEIKHLWTYNTKAADLEERIATLIKEIKAREEDRSSGIIFLASQKDEAVKLLVEMKRKGVQQPIIAGDAISDATAMLQLLAPYPEERVKPGYFVNGIYAATSLIFDIAERKALEFRRAFRKKYQIDPSWIEASYYDAAKVAVEALQRAGIQGHSDNLRQERQQIRDALAAITSLEKAVDGLNGPIYFDHNRNAVKAVHVGLYDHGKFISALMQLKPVPDLRRVLDLEQEIATNQIFLVNNQYMYKTQIVYTGIDLNEITNLDLRTSSYTMDFYLWFRYRGQGDPTRIQFLNAIGEVEWGEPIAESITNGVTYKAYRLRGLFRGEFDFRDFPFDQQHLTVQFRHQNLPRHRLIYVRDEIGMRDTSDESLLSRWRQTNAFASLSNWNVRAVDVFQDITISDSTLGNPQFFDTDSAISYSRFTVDISIQRGILRFGLKTLFPVFLLTSLSFLIICLPFRLIIPPALISILLALIFFHLYLSNALPPGIGYIVALDYAFYTLYGLVILEMLVLVLGNSKRFANNEEKVNRLLKISRWLYLTILLIMIGGFLIRYGHLILPSLGR